MLEEKLQQFKLAVDAIKVALVAKGLSITKLTVDLISSFINQIVVTKSMGSKSVTFTQQATIYGVRVKQEEMDTEKRVEYIESAKGMVPISVDKTTGEVTYNGWDKTWIFDKIYPVMLKTNGTEDYKLNPNDYSKKATGGNSDIANYNYDGNAMVHIDCYYSKYYLNGGYEYYLIADAPVSGFEPIGFKRADGSVMKYSYMPMFKGILYNQKLRSLSGVGIQNHITYDNAKAAALKNGTGYCLETYGMHNNLDLLVLLLAKNENTAKVYGDGRPEIMNDGNNMGIATGYLKDKGPIAYDPNSKGIKFMHVEDYWGNNIFFYLSGFAGYDRKAYVKWGGPYDDLYARQTSSGYTQVEGWPDEVNGSWVWYSNPSMKYGRIPSKVFYSPGSGYYQNTVFYPGQAYNSLVATTSSAYANVWSRNLTSSLSGDRNVGASLAYEPPK